MGKPYKKGSTQKTKFKIKEDFLKKVLTPRPKCLTYA